MAFHCRKWPVASGGLGGDDVVLGADVVGVVVVRAAGATAGVCTASIGAVQVTHPHVSL